MASATKPGFVRWESAGLSGARIVDKPRRERASRGGKSKPDDGRPALTATCKTLVGHDDSIDDVDYAVRLEDVGNGDERSASLFVFQNDVIAILQ
jgi:hypothetical protein